MALFVVLSDFSGPSTISAGSILDSDAYDLPSLQASGLAVLPYTSAMDPAIAAYLAQRGSAPSQAAQGDLTASLAAAGFIGGGGGGITTLTGFPPVSTTVAGSSATVGLVPGSTPGDVLAWDGSAWTGTALPASVASVTASAPLASSGGSTPDISISAGSSPGDVLTWNGSAWTGATPTAPSDVLWEWNGTDTAQFDLTPVTNAGQTASISVSGQSAATNKAFSTLNLAATWAIGGGAAVFRVPALVLPEQFRLRIVMAGVDSSGIRIGPFFFDPATWGSSLYGGGITHYGSTMRGLVANAAGGGLGPFDFIGATYSWADPGTVLGYNGALSEWEVTLRPGNVTAPPSVAMFGAAKGSASVTTGYATTLERGMLLGNGTRGTSPAVGFNGKSLTGFGVCAASIALGSFSGSFAKIQILKAI